MFIFPQKTNKPHIFGWTVEKTSYCLSVKINCKDLLTICLFQGVLRPLIVSRHFCETSHFKITHSNCQKFQNWLKRLQFSKAILTAIRHSLLSLPCCLLRQGTTRAPTYGSQYRGSCGSTRQSAFKLQSAWRWRSVCFGFGLKHGSCGMQFDWLLNYLEWIH